MISSSSWKGHKDICTCKSINNHILTLLQSVFFWNKLHHLKPFKWIVLNGNITLHTVGSPNKKLTVYKTLHKNYNIPLEQSWSSQEDGIGNLWSQSSLSRCIRLIDWLIEHWMVTICIKPPVKWIKQGLQPESILSSFNVQI